MAEAVIDASFCTEGHLIFEENAVWHKDPRMKKGGYWQCKKCGRGARKQWEERQFSPWEARKIAARNLTTRQVIDIAAETALLSPPEDRERIVEEFTGRLMRARIRKGSRQYARQPEDQRSAKCRTDILEAIDRMAKDESKKPWKYLQIKPEARAAWDKFDTALEHARNTGENVPNCQDNPAPYMDYDDENPPTAEEAYSLCYGCPLIELCATFSELGRPAHGVWAGDRWEFGQIVSD
jgi:hypothetical protein